MSLTGRGRKWELVSSLWVLAAALPVLHGFAWIWAGMTVRKRWWTVLGVAFIGINILTIWAYNPYLFGICCFILVCMWIVSFVLALISRRKYLLLRELEVERIPARREAFRQQVLSHYGESCADARYEDRGRIWAILNSLWILISCIPFVNCLAFFYICISARWKKWLFYGYLHTIISFGGYFFYTGLNYFGLSLGIAKDISRDLILLVMASGLILGIIQAFRLCREHLIRRDAVLRMKHIWAQERDETLREHVIANTGTQKDPKRKRAGSRPVKLPASIQQANADISPEPAREQAPLLDLNRCTEQQLAALPGVGIVLAKKAIRLRDENGGFDSPAEFVAVLELRPHFAAQIQAACTATRPSAPRSGGRVLDI